MGSGKMRVSLAVRWCRVRVGQLAFVEVGRREHPGHGMVLAHLLQHLDEEANLNLCRLLQQGIEGSGPLGLTKDSKPLFNSTEFVLEVLVQRRRSHLLQRRLVLVDIGDPLLRQLVLGIQVAATLALALLRLTVEVGRGPDAARGGAGYGGHVGRGAEVLVVGGADGPSRGWAERRDLACLRGAHPVVVEMGVVRVGHVDHVQLGGRRGVDEVPDSRKEGGGGSETSSRW